MQSIQNELILKMFDYYSGDPARIQHLIKVHSFAKMIGVIEGLDAGTLNILEIAAIVHDIGIKPAEEKYGNAGGKLQEQEGPPVAREMLTSMGQEAFLIDRVSFLIAHHHTYADVIGIDYQILIEADFLVNMYESHMTKENIVAAYENNFRTAAGKLLCQKMFRLQAD